MFAKTILSSLASRSRLFTFVVLLIGLVSSSSHFRGPTADAAYLPTTAGQGPASVIYSNFGPGMTFETSFAYAISCSDPFFGSVTQTMKFTPAANATLTSALLPLFCGFGVNQPGSSCANGQPGNATVFLQADLNGVPGAVLEQFQISGVTNVPTIFEVTSILRPELKSGTPYWLTVSTGAGTIFWFPNSVGDTSVGASSALFSFVCDPGGPWFFSVPPPPTVRTAFQINGVQSATVGPGPIPDARSAGSDQKAGSVLFFNIHTSSLTNPNSQNTRINLTNTSPSEPTFVHLFFVDGSTCSVADSFLCLTPNQTTTFLASEFDPGTTGYVVAVAVDRRGCPVDFNYLIGDEYVKFSSGHSANLGAEALSAIAGGPRSCDPNSDTAVLAFDNVAYNAVPRVLAVDNILSRGDGNDTLLVLNRFGGNLATGTATLANLFGILYDDAEAGHSFSFSPGTCQFRSVLSNSFPRTAPRFEAVIPSGQSGWMKLFSTSDIGMLGAVINVNVSAVASAGGFSQGHNLHKLRLTTSMVLTIPVFPPGC